MSYVWDISHNNFYTYLATWHAAICSVHSTLKDVGMLLQLQNCITDGHEWCTSRRLQLNDAKADLVWFGSRSNLTKLASSDCSLLVGGNIIKPSTTVCDLGVLLDSELSLKQHVNKVVSSCYYHIRRLRQVSHCVWQDVMNETTCICLHPV